jgi:hypothetical protein
MEKYVLREHESISEMNHRWEAKMVYNELEWYEYLIRINCIFEKLKMHKHVCETKSNINEMYCEMKQ